MRILNESIHNTHPSWHPNAFIVDLCPRGNQLHQVKSLPLIQQIASYLLYMSLAPMNVTCINIDCI
jgi:hypothetical protein